MLMKLEDLLPGDVIKLTEEYKKFSKEKDFYHFNECFYNGKFFIVEKLINPIRKNLIGIYYYTDAVFGSNYTNIRRDNISVEADIQVFEIVSLKDDE